MDKALRSWVERLPIDGPRNAQSRSALVPA